MNEPDADDVVQQRGAPVRLPGWARRWRWLPAPGQRPSRAAAILGIAGMIVGLAAGYALGYQHLGQAVRPPRTSPSRATAAGAVPSAVTGFGAPVYPPPPPGGPAYSSNLGSLELSGLAQTGGACSVQRGRELQVGVEGSTSPRRRSPSGRSGPSSRSAGFACSLNSGRPAVPSRRPGRQRTAA